MCAVATDTTVPTNTATVRQNGDHEHPARVSVVEAPAPTNDVTDDDNDAVTNEYVLNVAFLSFLVFTTLQFFFALLARSQSMMADCAAMYVDVVTYLFNFWAERLKHGTSVTTWTVRDLKLYRLYLELIPPFLSVTTLVTVTVVALQKAIETLLHPVYKTSDHSNDPDVTIMLWFSGLNLILDFLNVSCFARIDQAVGLPGQHGYEKVHVVVHHHSEQHLNALAVPNEETPLTASNSSSRPSSRDSLQNDIMDQDDDQSYESEEIETGGLNLNMCSAWTHICADTLRSITVLIAAGFCSLFPDRLSPVQADSWGAIVVSFIILVSLAPLFQGIYGTACKIHAVYTAPQTPTSGCCKSNLATSNLV